MSPRPEMPGTDERSLDRQIARWLAVFLFAYYLLTLGGHHYSIDGIVMFQAAKALLFQHSLRLDPPIRWGEVSVQNFYGLGFTFAYVPVLLLWWPLFQLFPGMKAIPVDPTVPRSPALYANLPYLLCSWLNPALTAATGCVVFALGRAVGLSRAWALAAALGFGLASPAAAYARMDFGQPLAALMLALTAWALLRAESTGRAGHLLAAGAALGWAILTRVELAVIAPALALWILLRSDRRRPGEALLRLALLAAPIVAAVAASMWLDQARGGGRTIRGPAPMSYMFAPAPLRISTGVLGLLVSPGRGLLLFFPLAWLAVPGLVRLLRTRWPSAVTLAGLIAVPFGLYATFFAWWGGAWCWGPRLLVPVLPLVSVAAAVGASRLSSPVPFVVLAGLGVLASLNGILFDYLDFGRWLFVTQGYRDIVATQFSVVGSTLVSGWFQPPGKAIDLLWLRLLDAEQLQRYGSLILGPGASEKGWIVVAGRTAALAGLSLLLGCLWYSGRRLARLAARPG